MIRLLQAMAGGEHGGAEAFFERLVPALGRAGIEQKVLIRRHPTRAARLRAGGIEPEQLGFGGPLDLATSWGFGRAVARFRPRVVLTWMSRATRFCPPARGRFVHVARLGGYYDLKYYRHCDHLVGNTRDICDWITGQGWDPARVHYLPNFVEAATAPPVARGGLATPDDAPLILALGRLHENKAFDVLLRALAAVPGATLWMAGDGPLRPDLEELARRLGIGERVRFLGWRDDVAALFAAADLFVCPSRVEPLGNVVIEAWAQGVPVVAAAAQGPRELIADGEDGVLVPVDDADALAAALGRLIADPGLAGRLAAAGRQAFAARFTEESVVRAYVDFLDRVAA